MRCRKRKLSVSPPDFVSARNAIALYTATTPERGQPQHRPHDDAPGRRWATEARWHERLDLADRGESRIRGRRVPDRS